MSRSGFICGNFSLGQGAPAFGMATLPASRLEATNGIPASAGSLIHAAPEIPITLYFITSPFTSLFTFHFELFTFHFSLFTFAPLCTASCITMAAMMFGRSITLFHLFGFRVRADASWLIVAALVTWSLATGGFPALAPDLDPVRYWIMGIAGTIILFLSIIAHEFSHALVARQFGIPMKGITLFLFGGVAEMDDEPPSAKAELLMAIAGPAASVVISIGFFIVAMVGELMKLPREVLAVLWYLGIVNAMLVVFNMIPAFPLDGGRVARSLLWMWKGELRWATRVASQLGSFFGILLIVLGITSVFMNNLIGGIWWFLIGMFLRNAASMSYKNVIVRETLQGEPVTRVMRSDPITVSRVIPVSELVENFIYRHHHKMFPVVDEQRLIGCVTTNDVKELDRAEWERQTVGSIAKSCDETNTIPPDTDALEALTRMSKSGVSRLMVVEEGRLLGILTLKDLMNLLQRKLELEG